MNRNLTETLALRILAIVVLGARAQAQTPDAKAPYPSMAPLTSTLLWRTAEPR